MDYKGECIHFTDEEVALSGLYTPYPVDQIVDAQMAVNDRLATAQYQAALASETLGQLPFTSEVYAQAALEKRTRANKLALVAADLAVIGTAVRLGAEAEAYLRDQTEGGDAS